MPPPANNPSSVPPQSCMKCGYSLEGVTSQFRTCPECGEDNDAEMVGVVNAVSGESMSFSRNLALGFPIVATVLMLMAYLLAAVVFSWAKALPYIMGALAFVTVLVDGFAMAMWFSAHWRAAGDRGMRPRQGAFGGVAALCYCAICFSIGFALLSLGAPLIMWVFRWCG